MSETAPETSEWLADASGNRCSILYFGSTKAAQAALDSLRDCENCTNCFRCSGCSGCSGCSDCSGCTNCSGCSRCSDCSGCSDCSDCSGCSDCSDCSDCSRGSDCSGCSSCSGCWSCSDCSGVAWLYDKKNLTGDPDVAPYTGPPQIPVIEGIHGKVLEAASQPRALDMSTWHRCGTTHCRAGWAVHLAGEAGYALERFHGTALAAQIIYRESAPVLPVSPVRFYDSNDDALADMKAMAEREAA